MRTALLPTTGNPYVPGLWLESYRRFWRDEVDRLYATVAFPYERPVMNYVLGELGRAGALLAPFPDLREPRYHGEGIDWLLCQCAEGLVVLLEEDCIVLSPRALDRCFRMLEEGDCDIVASLRGSCSHSILVRSQQAFGTDGDPHFWPNLFFTDRALCELTDRQFCWKVWAKGDYISQLDYVCTEEGECGDTFVWASIQMRAARPRVSEIPQHCTGPTDLDDFASGAGLFAGKIPWVHIGALGSGMSAMMDEQGMMISLRERQQRGHMEELAKAPP